jgi:hypothetical protein
MAKRKDTDTAKSKVTPEIANPAPEFPALIASEQAAIEVPKVETAAAPEPVAERISIEVSKFETHADDRPMAEPIPVRTWQPPQQLSHEEMFDAEPPAASSWSASSYLSNLRAHLPLAASLTIAALLGGLAGAAATGGLTNEPSKPAVETRTAADDARSLRETLVRISSEIQTLKSSVESANRNSGAQINKLGERMDRAEKAQTEPSAKIAKIVESLDRLEKRQAAAAVPATTVAAVQPPAAPEITGSVEKLQSKPPVAEGWKLHEYFGGRAVVENRTTGGLFEVGPGSNLPGLGRVETIRREDNRVIVVTPKGIISASLDQRRSPNYR